jgi:hypothetical protein
MNEKRVRANKKNEEIENLKLKIMDLEVKEICYQREIKEKETTIFDLKIQMQNLLATLENICCLSDFKKK